MPDVRLPDGTIVKNVPDGTTQSQLMERLARARGPSMGPVNEPASVQDQRMYQQVAADAGEGETGSFLDRMNARFKPGELAPQLGMGAGMLVPGAGWSALALQSLVAGGSTALGEVARQHTGGQSIDLEEAAKSGAAAGAANFAGGAVIKGLGAAAKKVFSSPLSAPQEAAAQFAREKGAPFPMSSAAPGTPAARAQQASRGLLAGEIKTQADANTVTQFLNRELSNVVDKASPVDEAALAGQQYLRTAFEPGETIYTQTFQGLRQTLGDETAIPLTNTRAAMEGVSTALKERGEMKAVFNRFRNILKGNATEQTVAQLDELYSGILKDTARNANARREANVVLSAIAKDIDAVSADAGFSFSEQVGNAKAIRDQFRELRNIPQLERLSKPFGDKGGALGSRQWMTELFSNPNGKALAELRTRNPELYHDLADSWLASNLNRFSKSSKVGIGRALDGPALRAWYEQNAGNLKLIMGAPQAQALDNFTLYAQHMARAVERSTNPSQLSSDPMALLARGGAELTGMIKAPYLMIPGEGASFVLARGLSDPNSTLFRLFTKGFSPATRSFVVKSGSLGSQAAAHGQDAR